MHKAGCELRRMILPRTRVNKGQRYGGRDGAQLVRRFLCWGPIGEDSHSDVGSYVLVEAEEVVRVIAALECLEPVVLLCPVGLSDARLPLLHQEVHVNAHMVGFER